MSERDELTAWLAERLFPPKERPGWWWFRNTSDELPDLPAPPGQEPLWAGPDLSGSWEGAGLVLEAMHERGYTVQVVIRGPDCEWAATFSGGGSVTPIWAGLNTAAPMAVCLAAEAALKVADG